MWECERYKYVKSMVRSGVLLGRFSSFVAGLDGFLVELADSVYEGCNDDGCEDGHIGDFGSGGEILDGDTQKFHFVALGDSFFLFLLGFPLLLADLVFLVELFDEFGDEVLFFGGGEVVADVTVADALEEGEETLGVELVALDIELD